MLTCVGANYNCTYGTTKVAFGYTGQKGIELASDYPATSKQGTCKYDENLANRYNEGAGLVTPKSASALKSAITNLPITVAIDASQRQFQFYSGGVITNCPFTNANHYVLAVGYGSYQGTDAFILKNSWSVAWGVNGYAYISTDTSIKIGRASCRERV